MPDGEVACQLRLGFDLGVFTGYAHLLTEEEMMNPDLDL
jgi:hypothetical protein